MTDTMDKKIWSSENLIKLFGLGLMLGTQFFLLKQEIHDNKTLDNADKQVINYRLNELEKCCNIQNQFAILPKETQLETENKNK
jgi:hypothetical protein